MADDATVTRYYNNLALGQMSSAPPRSMDPESGAPLIWRNSLNFVSRDNVLQRRGGLVAWSPQPSTANPGFPIGKGECPLIILTESNSSSSDFMAVVTTRQVLVHPNTATGWRNATPQYATGTVAVTNGSNAVVGTGTAWLTRFITQRQFIVLAGVSYDILLVNSDTSITLVQNYAGATISGLAYAITRNWREEVTFSGGGFSTIFVYPDTEISAVLFNENLYVAGTRIGGADGTSRPAVIKVSDVFSNTPTTSYITARDALVAGLDVISGLSRIAGIQCLQDGRVVFIGNSSTVFYSSHLNDAVWNTSPAGQVDITLVNGKLNALGKIGNNLTLHEDESIVWGYPTGLSDPPLRYQLSSAGKGCSYYRTLRSFGGFECFVSSDLDACMYDGNSVESLGNGEFRKKNLGVTRANKAGLFASADAWRREYTVFGGQPPTGGGGGTDIANFDVYQFGSNSWWPCQVGLPVTASSDTNETFNSKPSSRSILGVKTNDNGSIQTNMVYQLDDSLTSDPTSFSHGVHGPFYLETDDLDFGQPLLYKTVQNVVLWLRRTPVVGSSENFTVSASTDNGNTYTDVAKVFTYGAFSLLSIPIQSCFSPDAPGAGTTLRIKLSWSGSGTAVVNAMPERMHITCQSGGDIRTTEL